MQGQILLGVWYRPPARGEVESTETLYDEVAHFDSGCIGRILIRDANLHNLQWSTYWKGNSIEGNALYSFCCSHGMSQCVKEPTRESYLLDLVMTDVGSHLKVSIGDGLADHRLVEIRCKSSLPVSQPI